jgi:hypothetical protein
MSQSEPVRVNCPTCGALFIDGVHHWAWNEKRGNAKDLAGLVCNPHSNGRPCINPAFGDETGDTWEKRYNAVKKIADAFSPDQ